jgi:uncharacterized membrane protein
VAIVMEYLVLLFIGLVLIAVFVRSGFHTSEEVAELRRMVRDLRRDVDALKHGEPRPQPEAAAERPAAVADVRPAPAPAPLPGPARGELPVKEYAATRQGMFERLFGGRAFVWMGGVALALAGFFLVKYSIDIGLLTETVRVVLGIAFGIALLAASQYVRARIADGTRIAQALAGAGIADLYGSLFAGTTLYHLLPSLAGFGAMAVVTATALILSLRHGSPIAALGLLGGYATPVLIQGDANTPLLFGYLYIVFAALSALARGRTWQWLSVPAIGVCFLWVIAWTFLEPGADNALWLSLFLFAVAVTAVVTQVRDPMASNVWLRSLSPAGSLVLLGVVTFTSKYGLFEWSMFGLLSVCTMLLAWFDRATYRFVPLVAMAANLLMLFGWQDADPARFAFVLMVFALLFGAGAQLLMTRSDHPILWAGQSAATSLCYFLTAYTKLNGPLTESVGKSSAEAIWAAIAVGAAGVLVMALTQLYTVSRGERVRHILQAIYSVAATSLLSIGIAIIVRQAYLPFAAAAQVCALAWIGTRVAIPVLRIIAQVMLALFALLLLPEVFRLLVPFFQNHEPVSTALTHALFRFGVPAALFAAASRFLSGERNDRFVQVLEIAATVLIAAFGFQIVNVLFTDRSTDFGLLQQALQNNLLLAVAITALRYSSREGRVAIFWAGVGIGAFVVLRIAFLDVVAFNPIWSHQWVGAVPFLNVVLLAYGTPAAFFLAAGPALTRERPAALTAQIAGYVLAAITLTLWVRQIFEGTYLDGATASNAEVYAYSAVWLLGGIVLLFLGVLRTDATIRVASLVVMLLTVGKVFLYDAAQLTGLWRVLSFLGLGVSLLGLSWFYSRFVFTARDQGGS